MESLTTLLILVTIALGLISLALGLFVLRQDVTHHMALNPTSPPLGLGLNRKSVMQTEKPQKIKGIFLPILVGWFLMVGSAPSVSWGAGDLTIQDSTASTTPAEGISAASVDDSAETFRSLTLTTNDGVTVNGVQRTIQSGAINRFDEQMFSSSLSAHQSTVRLSWKRDAVNSYLNCDPNLPFYKQTDTITNETVIYYNTTNNLNFLVPGKVMEVQVVIPQIDNLDIDTTTRFPLADLNGNMTIILADAVTIKTPLAPDIPPPGAAAAYFGLLSMPVPLDDMVQMEVTFTGAIQPPLGPSQTVPLDCPSPHENLIGTKAFGTTQLSLTNVSVELVIYEPSATDADGDSLQDNVDGCPNSDMRLTVSVNDCSSGVQNVLNPYGDSCTLADLVQQDFDTGGPEALLDLLANLQHDGILTIDEADAITACTQEDGSNSVIHTKDASLSSDQLVDDSEMSRDGTTSERDTTLEPNRSATEDGEPSLTPPAGDAEENDDDSTDEVERLEQQAELEAMDAEETRAFADQIREKANQRRKLADKARKRAQDATNQTVREVEEEAAKRENAEADRLDRLADDFDHLADAQQEASDGFKAKAEAEKQRLEDLRRQGEEARQREAEERARAEREQQTAEEEARKQREEAERRRNEDIDRQLERLNRQEKAKQEARSRLGSQPQTAAGQNTGRTSVAGSLPSGEDEPGSFPGSRVADVVGATARTAGSATRTTAGAVAGEVIGGALDIKTVIDIGNAVEEAARAVPEIEAEAERGINQLANDPSRGDIEEARRALRAGFDRGKDIVTEQLIK